MTMVMAPEIDWDGVAHMEQICSLLKIPTPPVRQWVDDYDFDPDAVKAELQKVVEAGQILAESRATFDNAANTEGIWEGTASLAMAANLDCQRTLWDEIIDFLLWLGENIMQIIDYIVDALRIIVAWIVFLITAFSLVAAVVILAGTFIGGAGIGAAFGALVDSGILAVAGAIVLIGMLVSLLLACVNWLVEYVQDAIQKARNDICGDGLPSLPDWDPEDFPPVWPS